MPGVARTAANADLFTAVAEARRRDILGLLAFEERSVGELVEALDCAQPSVSKHLRVLGDVGLVRSRRDGKRVLYRTNPAAIKPLHDWTSTFQELWRHQLSRIKARAEER